MEEDTDGRTLQGLKGFRQIWSPALETAIQCCAQQSLCEVASKASACLYSIEFSINMVKHDHDDGVTVYHV